MNAIAFGHETRRRKTSAIVLISGGLLHLVLLFSPVWIARGMDALQDHRLVTFLVLVSIWFLLEIASAVPRANSSGSETGPGWLVPAIPILLLLLFWAGALQTVMVPGQLSWMTVAGGLLMSIGMFLRCLAIRRLGRWFLDHVTLASGHALVTDGIYGVMRHPAEAGFLLLALGAAILLESPMALGIWCLLLCLVIWRIRLEDFLLAEKFPVEFSHYAKNVSAFLWRPGNICVAKRQSGVTRFCRQTEKD